MTNVLYPLSNRKVGRGIWKRFHHAIEIYYSASTYGKISEEIEKALLQRAETLEKEIDKIQRHSDRRTVFASDLKDDDNGS